MNDHEDSSHQPSAQLYILGARKSQGVWDDAQRNYATKLAVIFQELSLKAQNDCRWLRRTSRLSCKTSLHASQNPGFHTVHLSSQFYSQITCLLVFLRSLITPLIPSPAKRPPLSIKSPHRRGSRVTRVR